MVRVDGATAPTGVSEEDSLYKVPWRREDTLATRICLARMELALKPLKKDGQRRGEEGSPSYHFVKWDDVADQVGAVLAKHGIAMHGSTIETSVEPATTPGGKPTYRWRAKVELALVSADESTDRWTSVWDGVADDKEATGQSKATTYAMKDWLLKTFLLAGDESDAEQTSGSDLADAGGLADAKCPRCGRALRQLNWKSGPVVGCSGWRPGGHGCDFKEDGTLTEYISKLREREAANAPSGEFVDGVDGPRELTRSEADSLVRDAPPPSSPEWMTDKHRELMQLYKEHEQSIEARNAILTAGGAVLLGQNQDGAWVWKQAGLKSAPEKVLDRAIAALRALPAATPESVRDDLGF